MPVGLRVTVTPVSNPGSCCNTKLTVSAEASGESDAVTCPWNDNEKNSCIVAPEFTLVCTTSYFSSPKVVTCFASLRRVVEVGA